MAGWLGCKIWMAILFLAFGILYILKDYGFVEFKLNPLSAILIIIGLGLLLCPRKGKK